MTEIRRFDDAEALAQAAAQFFVDAANAAIKARGRFNVVLSGGSTPRDLHCILAQKFHDAVAWSKVNVFWGDERPVAPDHPDSNYHMAKETLLDAVPIPPENVHRMPSEHEPQEAATAYTETLKQHFEGQFPTFDLIFLGMGDDGHTASLFPGTAALQEHDQWVIANHVPKLSTWRITLTIPVINAAHQIAFLVSGTKKADTLREVVNGPYLPEQFPAQYIEPSNGVLIWFVDEAAGSLI